MTNLKSLPFVVLGDHDARRPLYKQIYETLRAAILSGRLPSGTRLPATRAFAHELGVSRITVVNAFEQLAAEGYLVGRHGDGTYVAPQLPEDLPDAARSRTMAARAGETIVPPALSAFATRLADARLANPLRDARAIVPFRNGITEVREFPFGVWEKLAAAAIRRGPRLLRGYDEAAGFLPLRTAVAAWLRQSRGVECEVEQVFITNGAQQAIDLVTRVLLDAGDSVAVEDPCYQEALRVFLAAGARVTAFPVDDEGVDAGEFGAAKLTYVTPSHQYPSGAVMTLRRRLALLEWARKTGAWIVEDDYNSEFRYAGRPLPSLQNLDRDGRVIYVGTFSKTIFPGLRLGCLVIPKSLAEILDEARNSADSHSPLMEQSILAEFIADGHFGRHLRRMRKLYEKRRDALADAVESELGELMTVARSASGMHLVGRLADGFDDVEVSRRGADAGLALAPLSSYCVSRKMFPGLILGYTAFTEDEIRTGVRTLGAVLRKVS